LAIIRQDGRTLVRLPLLVSSVRISRSTAPRKRASDPDLCREHTVLVEGDRVVIVAAQDDVDSGNRARQRAVLL